MVHFMWVVIHDQGTPHDSLPTSITTHNVHHFLGLFDGKTLI